MKRKLKLRRMVRQIAIMGPSLAIAPVYIAANEEQKKKYLGEESDRKL